MSLRIYFGTAPPADAARIARRLVELRLAACINVIPQVQSFYTWQDRLQEDEEAFLVIKSAAKPSALSDAYAELHPYDIPAFTCIAVDQADSLDAFVAWVKKQSLDSCS